MPTGFRVKSSHPYSAAAAVNRGGVTLRQLKKWGYAAGYESDFVRDVSLSDLVHGAIEIDSSASVYRTSSGAKASLASSGKACHTSPATELSVGARIGDEAHLCSIAKRSGGYTIQTYTVVWRQGRLKGAVLAAGLKGGISPTQVVQLAKIQSRRMR